MPEAHALLALVTDAFGGRGGIAQYNRDLLAALAKAGSGKTEIRSITILPRHAPDQLDPPEGIHQMRPLSGRLIYTLRAIAVAISKPVDVVFCGHLYMSPLAALIARLKGAKLIVQTHGIEAWSPPSRLQRAALENADLVLCVSRDTRARILSWANITPERAVVLPNTVSEMFRPGASSLHETLGLVGKIVLLSVGRMDTRERYKGQDWVIRALPELIDAGHDVIYLMVGEGDDLARLQQVSSEVGVDDRVRFVGSVRRQELVEYYRMADLFVLPSTGEGFGIAFLEAMASGTPALGLNVAGARDALTDGIAVDESEFRQALRRALEDPLPSGDSLAGAVRERFGPVRFAQGVGRTLDRLQAAQQT